ncbi:hypothetical protein MKW98_007938 [Papaver atlanticum]|uniref:Uncharacterized protein n=1 Tax=Papaver atlanticum TaxID=357466 RepID=A0AAD4S2B3_9MAGN|nr:hypothetical protein MKW98_022165 [Papaver atlanticum]KAI3856849.1 hypothetical protein MKW98_007938 [Papaver atlanticum]
MAKSNSMRGVVSTALLVFVFIMISAGSLPHVMGIRPVRTLIAATVVMDPGAVELHIRDVRGDDENVDKVIDDNNTVHQPIVAGTVDLDVGLNG